MSICLVQSPWTAYTFHARLSDIALLSKVDSVHHQTSLQPKPQRGESELTLTTRGSLHAVFAQMCMIAQLFGSKKGRVSNKKWNIGGLLKRPYRVALECLCLSVSSTFLLSWLLRRTKSRKKKYEIYHLNANFSLMGENRCSDKAGKNSCGKKAT